MSTDTIIENEVIDDNGGETGTNKRDLSKADLVVERTGVTYEEAVSALDGAGWDVLDAIVALEAAGKAEARSAHATTSGDDWHGGCSPEMESAREDWERRTRSGMQDSLASAWQWICDVWSKGMEMTLVASSGGVDRLGVPLSIALVAMILWEIVLPAMLISLFFGVRWRIDGPEGPLSADGPVTDASRA